ncbi:MAG: glycosyltransferase, partial [Candidatus Sumerlaeaceae bacterium]|nr:glycosyltransferase [Candidatus Sumerlaeaceae bacterium]
RLSRAKYHAPHVFYIAISEAVKSVLVAGGVPEHRISIVHSGVDPNRYAMRTTASRDEKAARWFGAGAGTYLIANVAALTDHKDQATLLRAAAMLRLRMPEFRLVIAGSGELEGPLRALQAQLGLESHVEFLGHLPDLAPLYRAADLFVMSSHLEGLCTSILDAMAAGVPVVATRAGGIPEIVRDGLNGLLVPVRDPEALAAAMETALRSPMLREVLSHAGRRTVEEEFSHDRMVDGTVEQYKAILAKYHRALAAGRAIAGGAATALG